MTEAKAMALKTHMSWLVALLALGCLCSPMLALAGVTTLKVNVTVIDVPCVVNGDDPIDVDFGNALLTNKVDGSNYQKNIDYSLDCTNASTPALKMMISGTGAGFDPSALQASQTDLGIRLQHDGKSLALNSWLNFTAGTQPVLQAVPVKAVGSTLTAGGFTAAATLTVDYQ